MKLFLSLCTAATIIACASPLLAQPVVTPPNFDVTTLTTGIPIAGTLDTMAVDRHGNVFLADEPVTPSVAGPRIHRVRPTGLITMDHATGFGTLSQMTYNPLDGFVYVCDYSPVLTVLNSRVWRLNPVTGKTLIQNVPVIVDGFTIDNDGMMLLGGTGTMGPGLYKIPLGGNLMSFLGSGFGANRMLQSLISGDVLIADGNEVRRWTSTGAAPAPYYTAPIIAPNGGVAVVSLARTPFNQIGPGAVVGVNSFSTFCLCGDGFAMTADLTGQNQALFATEPYAFNDRGLRAFATGLRQDLYWADLAVAPSGVVSHQAIIHKIRQLPAAGSPGSLVVNSQPALVTMHLYGDPAGFTPFLLGVAAVPTIVPFDGALFVPPFGIVELNPFALNYLPLLDGIGLFGPPNFLAVIPIGGHFPFGISIPPLPFPIPLRAQAIILDPLNAPNGLYFTTNVETFVIQ